MTTAPPGTPHDAPFDRLGPMDSRIPLVLAVPHAGRDYPAALLRDSAVPREVLEQLEDRHADRLVAHAVARGAVAIVARAARAWIDLNRGEEDLDPALRDPPGSGTPASPRCRAGLGLVPQRIGGRALWRRPPDAAAVAARIAAIHRPYHAAVAQALAAAAARHGVAVLIDCHSMPPLGGARPARLVIGDLHGRSAAPAVSAAALAAARTGGVTAVRNAPYAGAFSIACHGQPALGIHALQLEVDRSLYLASGLRTPSPGLPATAMLVDRIACAAVAAAEHPAAIAAE